MNYGSVQLRLCTEELYIVSEEWWRRFLFSQAIALNDRRPLKSSKKQFFRSEYLAFCNAKLRCTDLDDADYGGRGIQFCFSTFDEFMDAIGPRPAGHVLDRINNDGNYEVGNVRWSTPKQSSANSRNDKPHRPGSGRPKKVLDNVPVVLEPTSQRGTGTNEHMEPREEQRAAASERAG